MGSKKNDINGLFTDAIGGEAEGYFALLDIDGKVKATPVFTMETLKLYIGDVLSQYPDTYYRILPESEFERVIGQKRLGQKNMRKKGVVKAKPVRRK